MWTDFNIVAGQSEGYFKYVYTDEGFNLTMHHIL